MFRARIWSHVLEYEIAEHLAANGWRYSPTDAGYDRELALLPDDVLGWLEDSQPAEFAKVVRPGDTAAQQEAARRLILSRLAKTLDNDPLKNGGTIRMLHDGFSMVPLQRRGGEVRAGAVPAGDDEQPRHADAYAKMRVRVMRQVHYSVEASEQGAGSGAVRQRHPGGDDRVEDRLHAADRQRGRAVPVRP